MYIDCGMSGGSNGAFRSCHVSVKFSVCCIVIDIHRSYRWHSLHDRGYNSVIDLAKTKLNPTLNFRVDIIAQLACVGIRIGLDIHPSRQTARQIEVELVRAYMRVVFTVSESLDAVRTGTPSEPVVAEAAARLINSEVNFQELPPRVLARAFEKGYVADGERAEMVGRLLWTLAHDTALRYTPWRDTVHYHKPLSVINFLKSLFHQDHWNTILNARPLDNEDGPPLLQAFKDAYIHFSHFVDGRGCKVMQLEEVYKLLLRGAALHCDRKNGSINFLAPILFGPPDSTAISLSASSVLQAQVSNYDNPGDVFLSSTFINSANQQPVLSLVHQLGSSKHSVECDGPAYVITSTKDKKNAPPHYQVVAHGCSSAMYGVIPEGENRTYAELLQPHLHIEEVPHRYIRGYGVDMANWMDPAFGLEQGNGGCEWFGEEME